VVSRIKEFSSLPSARLTVDSFRDVWLQSAADPPGYDRPQVPALEDGTGEDGEDDTSMLEGTETAVMIEEAHLDDSLTKLAEADAAVESEEFQNLLDERELEAEINRHLGYGKFQEIQYELDEQDRMSSKSCFPSMVSNFWAGLRREEMENAIKAEDDNLSDLDDDDEVAGAIISEDSEHFVLRAQLWIEANKEYLREQRGNTPRNTFPSLVTNSV
jgi:hypothetical protein